MRHALAGLPSDLRVPNLSLCHGLSGLGEIFLEAGRVLAEPRWIERARRIARTLVHLRRERQGAVAWMVEEDASTADLMVGGSGVLHFLLRLSGAAPGFGFPLLPGPSPTP